MRYLILLLIVAVVILIIAAVVYRNDPAFKRVIVPAGVITLIALTAIVMTGIVQQQQAIDPDAEIGRHEYSKVLSWRDNYPDVGVNIDAAMADDRVTWGEFHALEELIAQTDKRRLRD